MKTNRVFDLKKMVMVAALCLGLSLSAIGRSRTPVNPRQLTPATEVQTVGGDPACAWVGGITVGLAIGTFTPCSVFCLAGALTGVVFLAGC